MPTTKLVIKHATLFECEICLFKCCKKSNYTMHLSTRKHKILTNTAEDVKVKEYICKCGKVYKFSSSLCFHKKTCTFKEPEVMMINEADINELKELINQFLQDNLNLKKENQDFKTLLVDQQKQILDLIPKVHNQPKQITNNQIINNNNNQIINNNITNNITINGFGFETITHILEDPNFINLIRDLITNNYEEQTFIELYKLMVSNPLNKNLSFEKPTSRLITTQDENGNMIKKTRHECYINIMIKLKEIFIKYLDLTFGFKFKGKTATRTVLIKRRLDIDKEQYDYTGDKQGQADEHADDVATMREITDGFVAVIREGSRASIT